MQISYACRLSVTQIISYAQYFGLHIVYPFPNRSKKAELTPEGKWLITNEHKG